MTKPRKIGSRILIDFLHAAQVEHDQRDDQRAFGDQLVRLEAERQQAEQRIHAAGDRDRDGEHVVDDQRRAGGQAGVGPEQAGRDPIAAAAGRKQLDDLVVGKRDDEHRRRGGDRQVQAELGVLAERPERLLRAVAGRGDAVGAQPHPGEKRDQRDVVPGLLVERVERLATQGPASVVEERHSGRGGERSAESTPGPAGRRVASRVAARTPSSPSPPACRLCAPRRRCLRGTLRAPPPPGQHR